MSLDVSNVMFGLGLCIEVKPENEVSNKGGSLISSNMQCLIDALGFLLLFLDEVVQ